MLLNPQSLKSLKYWKCHHHTDCIYSHHTGLHV